MRFFMDRREDAVTDALDGLIAGSGGQLARLDGYPDIKVVHRADWQRDGVAVISGGGSGHEPAHAGFVGPGMLTAAVCGDVFASPSVDAVLAALLAVTGPAGSLLIVKNYTGDRLNFGLAAARARAAGLAVETVIVGDDIALPDLPAPRGIAGTLLVHKIAGALAAQGAALEAVAAAARKVVAGASSIGMALGTCRLPGTARADRIPDGKAELGLGIHGEPGAEQVDYAGLRAAMGLMAAKLAARMGEQSHVALVNNLGGASARRRSPSPTPARCTASPSPFIRPTRTSSPCCRARRRSRPGRGLRGSFPSTCGRCPPVWRPPRRARARTHRPAPCCRAAARC